jgi:hypothetical protein
MNDFQTDKAVSTKRPVYLWHTRQEGNLNENQSTSTNYLYRSLSFISFSKDSFLCELHARVHSKKNPAMLKKEQIRFSAATNYLQIFFSFCYFF